MDNICHTLVGAALGEAGLKRRSRLAMPALLLGANLPDVDVLAYFDSPLTALAFRRGWTHGPLGLLVLSALLAALMVGLDRATTKTTGSRPAAFGSLFLVILAAALTHPVLDFLNNYGVRWLMPVDRSWYYGDALFIVDPWVWGALVAGILWSRRRERRGELRPLRPARVSLAAVVVYVVIMGAVSVATRAAVVRDLPAGSFDRVMVAPVPLNPLDRVVLVETDHSYRFGQFSWYAGQPFGLSGRVIAVNDRNPLARAAAETRDGRLFLSWSRFPYYLVDESQGLVRIMDARYNADWASVSIPVALPRSPS